MTCLRIYALISLFLTGSLYSEDALPEKAMTLIDKKVKKYMKDQNIAGLSIGVIRDNKVVLTKGYGFSRIKTNERMSEDTIVTLASNSKPIIAAIILQLANEKKIDEAIGFYNKAIEIEPLYSGAYVSRGNCRIEIGEKKMACEDYQQALNLGDKKVKENIIEFCKD